jgi:hypothetical protein
LLIFSAAAAAGLVLAACSASSPAPATSAPAAGGPAASTASSAAVYAPTAEAVAKALGLTGVTAYTDSTDPNHLMGRQREYTSKVNWGDGDDNSIEAFADDADARARYAYLTTFSCPIGDGYDYLSGTVFLRLGCALTPDRAKTEKATFDAALKSLA